MSDDEWDFEVDRQPRLPFPLEIKKEPLTLDEAWLKDFVGNMDSRARKAADKAVTTFNALGIKVFNAGDKVGVTSTEADYGAPAVGLHFFSKFINAQRAFRYEPTQFIDEETRTHVPQARTIGKAMGRAGYTVFKTRHMGDPTSLLHFANGGVTRAFSDVMDIAIREFETLDFMRKVFKKSQGGVILMPMPTYGLFVSRLEEMIADKNIRIAAVRRQDSGAVDFHSLHTQIKKCEERGEKIIAYYDSNPNNPTGYIRERAETEKIGEMLKTENWRQIYDDLAFLREHKEILTQVVGRNKYNAICMNISDTPKGNLLIIDDMAYEGLQIKTSKKPFSFGQCHEDIAEMSLTLKGISKIGMPGMRIGMVIGHPIFISDLSSVQFMKEFCANSLGVDIFAARYGAKQDRAVFRAHEKKLRDRHSRAVERLQVFFKGIDNVPALTDKHRGEIIRDYAAHAGIDGSAAEGILKKGMPNLNVNNGPESGFFQCVDCEALRDRRIAIQTSELHQPFYAPIRNGNMLYWVFRAFDIKAIPGSYMGLAERSLIMRITYSLPEKDMLVMYDRLRGLHDHFWGPQPEVQLDLFRQPKLTAPTP